jgi:predicted nucleic acid-binding protein
VIPHYVLDTGALIAAERGKQRVMRFFWLARSGRARLVIPLAVVAEWWRGRTDAREEILASATISASLPVMQAAGVALRDLRVVDAGCTIDAIVIATAALFGGIVITSDPSDLAALGRHFPSVTVLST